MAKKKKRGTASKHQFNDTGKYDDQWGVDRPAKAYEILGKEGRHLAANDHPGYFGSMVSPQFRAYGQDNPFGQFLSTTALANAEQDYTNLLLQNRNLRFNSYMKRLGAGAAPGRLGALGTGQQGMVDTGNPFTSSSGTGGPMMSSGKAMPMGTPRAPQKKADFKTWEGTTLGASPFGLGKRGLEEYRHSPLGRMTGGKEKFATVGTNYTDMLRRQFLSLSPTERGETALGKTAMPGRWSPWG
jgi:hypothetical protein